MKIVCEDCGTGFEVNDMMAAGQVAQGVIRKEEIRHFRSIETRYLGECPECHSKHQAQERAEQRTRGSVVQEQADITRRMRSLQDQHPAWTREQCSFQAVEDHNDPHYEANADFRDYLLNH